MTDKDPASVETATAEVLIIGGGPAGLTAALYCARSGFKTLVLEGKGRSRMTLDYPVENYPGFVSVQSRELLDKFRDHARHFGAEILQEDAIDVNLSMDPKFAATRERLIEARAVILATGKPTSKKELIPGEEKLVGMGVSYCATCDGPLFRGRRVLAVGNSDEAAEDVAALKQMGVDVQWASGDGEDWKAGEEIMNRIRDAAVPLFPGTVIREISGQDRVTHVEIDENGETRSLEVEGVFLFKEMPSSSLLGKSGLEFDHRQCLITDRTQKTNLEGVYAAGDITCGGLQIVTAAGAGAQAAMQVMKFLRRK